MDEPGCPTEGGAQALLATRTHRGISAGISTPLRGIVTWQWLRFTSSAHSVGWPGSQTVDGFGREGHQAAGAQHLGRPPRLSVPRERSPKDIEHNNLPGNATSAKQSDRAELLDRARRHGVPTVALLVATPVSVCVARQQDRPDNRRVPQAVVKAQHAAIVAAFPGLPGEGFDHVVFAENIDRLEPMLQRLNERRSVEQGLNSGDGLGDLLLVRRCFGPEVLPMWRWLDGSQLAGGDRIGEIRLGRSSLTLALRREVDREGDTCFEILLACPSDVDGEECPGPAWAPVRSVSDLHKACLGELDRAGLVCAACGYEGEIDHEAADHAAGADDREGQAELEAQYAEAVRP